MDEEGRGATGESSAQYIPKKISGLILFFLFDVQQPAVEIFGGKVEGLGWKVADNVDPIAPPKRYNSLFPDAPGEAVSNPIVFGFQLCVLGLCLEQQFDSFDGRGQSFSDDAGHSSSEEVK